jgi:hypothetical protein
MEHALPWSATANSWQYTTIYDANRATVCRFDLEDRGVTEDNQDTLEKQQEQTVNLVVIAVNSYATLTARVEELEAALRLQEIADHAHVNCDECEGEEAPELCPKCFPLYDDARIARRAVLQPKGAAV